MEQTPRPDLKLVKAEVDKPVSRFIDDVELKPAKKKLRTVNDHLKEDEALDPSKMHLLAGLQGKNLYQGTVDKETVRRRRAKNKRAKAARRKNRG